MFKRFKSIDDFFFDLLTKQWNGMEFYETQFSRREADNTTFLRIKRFRKKSKMLALQMIQQVIA